MSNQLTKRLLWSGLLAALGALAFYGAIEQVLTGWIFGLLDEGDEAYERAKAHLVETISDGLAA